VTEKEERSAFQRIFGAVKRDHGKRRFEGIGVALFVVGLAALAAALSAPRATEPDLVPLPVVDRTVLRRVQAKSDALAREARDKGLTYDVRAVGDAFRRAGAATVEGKGAPESAMGEIVLAVRLARQKGSDRGLLALLALQAELFVEATKAFEKSGKPSLELGELGGDFLAIAKQNGWVEGRRILLDDDERAALFRVRWTELTGLRREAAFAPTLDEYRTYYSLYLRQAADADALRTERAFGVVRALEKRDPSYPGSFARGVLYYRKGLFDDAASAFRAHLAAHPDGPWTLRAKNHLLAALARGSGAD
jgi:tetratricopeptide (TPR) repeat protein